MADVDFSDLESATAWFETQTSEMRCVMSSRAALRVLADVSLSKEPHRKKLALLSMWAILTSAGRGLGRPADVDVLTVAARSAADSADSAADYFDSAYAAPSADSGARSAALSAPSAAYSADSAAYSAARSAALSAVSKDSRLSSVALQDMPVWGDTKVQDAIALNHANFLAYLDSDPDWAFFRRFYAEMWEGTFTDWDLAIEVATLDPELWEGEDALSKVAKAIREIEARRRLETEMSALRAELAELKAKAAPAVGHNQGPPFEDEDIAVRQSLELVWPILEELEQEVEKEEPNPETLKRLAEAFWQIAKTIAVYCGGKIDVALEKAAETVGESGTKWALRVGAATYLGSNQSVQSVAIAAWKYALTLLS